MSDNYIRLPTPAKAWKYDKQPQADWPQWVRDYEVSTTIGLQRIGAGPGILLIPTRSAITVNVVAGDYLVLEAGVLTIVKGGDFPNLFRPENVQEPEAKAINAKPATTPPEAAPVVEPEAPAAPPEE